MKRCILEANLEGERWQTTMFLKKEEHRKKDALKQKIEAPLYLLYWGFKKIPFALYTLHLCLI